MNLPKTAIITSVSALSIHGMISYSPAKLFLEMPTGTNVSSRDYDGYVISTQSLSTIKIGSQKYENTLIYSVERLFVELNKFPLENTIKEEAKRNLEKVCKPSIVKRIYDQLKNKRRGIDDKYIQNYLSKNYEDIVEIMLNLDERKRKDLLREYLISLVSSLNVPVILKGGSSIELFSSVKRATHDIDMHSSKDDIMEILNFIADKKHKIFFVPTNDSLAILDTQKRVYKLTLMPKTFSTKLDEYFKKIGESAIMEISFNTSFSSQELSEIIDDFKLSKRQLPNLKKSTCMSFSREMLLAEKFQSIIGKPENSTRTKDLIDLKLIFDEFDEKLFLKWFYKKFESQRYNLDHENAKKMVSANVEKELAHMKSNFEDAVKMYGLDFTYEQCVEIYKKLAGVVLTQSS